MIKLVRSIISAVSEGVIKRYTGAGRPDETFTDREYFQHYGFTSRPLPGAEGIALKQGNNIILVASDDRRYRIAVENGEVCIYTDEGDFIHFKRDKNIHVNTGNKLLADATNDVEVNTTRAVVNASESAIVTTPKFQVNSGEINLATDRDDLRRLIDQRFRELFNTHTHPNCGGPENSGPPNESLELDDVATNITRAM